jgi:murein DD-endopeptidase MepM/ murein hydrolase activator NlpD
VTSEFGPRNSPLSRRKEFHFGIDIAGPRGTPILATAEGEVVLASYRIGFGNTIIIDHGYGFTTVYAHLKNFNVHLGNSVQKGQVIGYMGSTGYSTGVHLHYEVHKKGVAVNPRAYLP